jgi:hypothetical protein
MEPGADQNIEVIAFIAGDPPLGGSSGREG